MSDNQTPPEQNNSFVVTIICVMMVIGIFIVLADDAQKTKQRELKAKQEQYDKSNF